jgi:hypothetical protein
MRDRGSAGDGDSHESDSEEAECPNPAGEARPGSPVERGPARPARPARTGGAASAAGTGGGGRTPEWELREIHLHPELRYAVLRPHTLAYKRAKMNDGSRFVTGVPKTAAERHSLRKQRRYALSKAERRRSELTQAEMAVVAEEHRRRAKKRDRGLQGLPGGGEVSAENVLASGVTRARKIELCKQMLPEVVCEQCPLAPLVGQRGARAGAGRKGKRGRGVPFDDMG